MRATAAETDRVRRAGVAVVVRFQLTTCRTAGIVGADVDPMTNLLTAVAILGLGAMGAAAEDATGIADFMRDVCAVKGDESRGRPAHHACGENFKFGAKRRHMAHEIFRACPSGNIVNNSFAGIGRSGRVDGDATATVVEIDAGYFL